jgi:hypothetical protein
MKFGTLNQRPLQPKKKKKYLEDSSFKQRERQLMTLSRNLVHISKAFDGSAFLQADRNVQVVNSGQHKPMITGVKFWPKDGA